MAVVLGASGCGPVGASYHIACSSPISWLKSDCLSSDCQSYFNCERYIPSRYGWGPKRISLAGHSAGGYNFTDGLSV